MEETLTGIVKAVVRCPRCGESRPYNMLRLPGGIYDRGNFITGQCGVCTCVFGCCKHCGRSTGEERDACAYEDHAETPASAELTESLLHDMLTSILVSGSARTTAQIENAQEIEKRRPGRPRKVAEVTA